jgi:D-3-phosphoglycerate dehydrogenase / 2-oxoglutarate reductase
LISLRDIGRSMSRVLKGGNVGESKEKISLLIWNTVYYQCLISTYHIEFYMLEVMIEPIGLQATQVDYQKPLLPQITEAEILINGLGKIDKDVIDNCHRLKLVQQIGTGTDNIDIDYYTNKAILVANTPATNNISVAEHTLFLMLYTAKKMKGAAKGLMKGRVQSVLGSELYGKILLVIGLGAIGTEVAKRATAFGMRVIAATKFPTSALTEPSSSSSVLQRSHSDPHRRASDTSRQSSNIGPRFRNGDVTATLNLTFVNEIHGTEKLLSLIPVADYVSLHTPLTMETRAMIRSRELDLMKRSAYLINVARAQIVDRDSLYTLYTALLNRDIAGAAFDVFWHEPADPDDRLLKLDNFVLTPHMAGWTAESVRAEAVIIAENLYRLKRGKVLLPLTLVNPDIANIK